jgi:hypothetical protein
MRPVLPLPAQLGQQVPAGETVDQLPLLRVVEVGQLGGQPAFERRQVRISRRQAALADEEPADPVIYTADWTRPLDLLECR